ncbi:unnamed protein product [Amoebophrya sp. A25]|nr:unnamed protein product [Amoebophrya sp. A25]|eukprot:GSA25T00018716001.1
MLNKSFALLFGAGLICGSINSITLKICYQTQVEGMDGRDEQYEKPWFFSFVMFLACLCALPVYYAGRMIDEMQRRKSAPGVASGMRPDELSVASADESTSDPVTREIFFYLLLPSMCDLLGTSLQQMGLCVTTVSVFQMLKGSILLFSAFLSVSFLGKRLTGYNWVGIGLCLIALTMVGMASVWGADEQGTDPAASDTSPAAQQAVGILLILIGQVICAAQYVVEEYLLRPPLNVTPMAIVGLEGFWGSVVMGCIVLPLCAFLPGSDPGGEYESTQDALFVLSSNEMDGSGHLIRFLVAVFFVSVLLYNIIGVTVTAESSAIHHTFLDASRTLLIWLVSIGLFYFVDPQYGEAITPYSWLQAIGFAILVLGQVTYEGIIRVPGLKYEQEKGRSSAQCSPLASYPCSPADRWVAKASPRGATTPFSSPGALAKEKGLKNPLLEKNAVAV